MRTVTHKVFTIDELAADVQEQAIENYRDRHQYGIANTWRGEWLESWRAFADHISVNAQMSMTDVETAVLEAYGSAYGEDILALSGVRAWTWLYHRGLLVTEDYCPTGYCGDYHAFQPLAEFSVRPDDRTLADVFEQCRLSWARAWDSDIESLLRNSTIREELEANCVEFYEDGRLYLV